MQGVRGDAAGQARRDYLVTPAMEESHFPSQDARVLLFAPRACRDLAGRATWWAFVVVTGDAGTIFHRLYAQLRELGWLERQHYGGDRGDGAEWIGTGHLDLSADCEIPISGSLEHAWASPAFATRRRIQRPISGSTSRLRSQSGKDPASHPRLTEAPSTEVASVAREVARSIIREKPIEFLDRSCWDMDRHGAVESASQWACPPSSSRNAAGVGGGPRRHVGAAPPCSSK